MISLITFSLFLLHITTTYTMNESQLTNQNEANSIPTLSALCRHQITKGYGKTHEEQRNNALKSLGMLYSNLNDEYMEKIHQSFIHNHWNIQQSPEMLLTKNNKLYGIFVKDIRIWDLSTTINGKITNKEMYNIHIDKNNKMRTITCALISQNKNILYTGSSGDNIKLWNTNNNRCIANLPNEEWIDAFAEQNNDLYVLTYENIYIWDINKQLCKQKLPENPHAITSWSLLVNNNEIYAAGNKNFNTGPSPIIRYDIRDNNYTIHESAHNAKITNLIKSKKNNQFYSSSFDKTIKIWDMRNMNQSLHTLTCDHNVHFIQENNAGTHLFSCEITNGKQKNNYIIDSVIKTWNTTTNKIVTKKIIPNEVIQCMTYDEYEDDPRLFIGTYKEIQIIMPEAKLDKLSGFTEK